MYRDRIRFATDEQLCAVAAFFDAPELRRYYTGLLEDIDCELKLRKIAKEDDDATPTP